MRFLLTAILILACAPCLPAQSGNQSARWPATRNGIDHSLREKISVRPNGEPPKDASSWREQLLNRGHTDAQIVDSILWFIKQPDNPNGQKAAECINIPGAVGMALYPKHKEIESALIDAQRNPQHYKRLHSGEWSQGQPIVDIASITAYFGSEEMAAEVRTIISNLPNSDEYDMGMLKPEVMRDLRADYWKQPEAVSLNLLWVLIIAGFAIATSSLCIIALKSK